MLIRSAEFLKSSPTVAECPRDNLPEFAFIGRSNVGKSSLINALVNHKGLAKTSSTPGKTKLINHFIINSQWYLVDLPGYGYAKTSKGERNVFSRTILSYLAQRANLYCVFVLVDSRHRPQQSDLEFINWLGRNEIPIAIVLTKSDKLSAAQLEANLKDYGTVLLEEWSQLPPFFESSSKTGMGRDEILSYIEESMKE